LFGFETAQERELFQVVLKVSGVGPSTALNLIAAGPDGLVDAVQNASVSFFTAIPRVGKKLAQKIIIELGSKLGEMKSLQLGPQSQKYQDILTSLTDIGFAEEKVVEVLRKIDLEGQTLEKSIKQAMKKLAQKA
jgi:holliday junction DNA helicase RuvA